MVYFKWHKGGIWEQYRTRPGTREVDRNGDSQSVSFTSLKRGTCREHASWVRATFTASSHEFLISLSCCAVPLCSLIRRDSQCGPHRSLQYIPNAIISVLFIAPKTHSISYSITLCSHSHNIITGAISRKLCINFFFVVTGKHRSQEL